MRSIERRFKNVQEKQPALSSVMCFASAIVGQCFSTDKISRWFTVLVDKDDYDQCDRRAILKRLVTLSNPKKLPEEHDILGKNASLEREM